MSNRSARRPLRFDDLPATLDEIHRLSEVGYVGVGKWDLAQICQHLNKTMRMSLEGAPFGVPRLLQPLAKRILFRKVIRGEPTYLPLKTVAAFQPEEHADPGNGIQEYAELMERIMSESSSLLDVHPVFGPITKAEWQTFHAWHAAHHLSFLIPNASPNESKEAPTEAAVEVAS